jgi:hypothetical protein
MYEETVLLSQIMFVENVVCLAIHHEGVWIASHKKSMCRLIKIYC